MQGDTLPPMQITVLGAGVIGLSTGVRLLEMVAGEVELVTHLPLLETTSVQAGAVWTITEVEPLDRTFSWAMASRERFERLSAEPKTGVAPLQMTELHHAPPQPSLWDGTPWVRAATRDELPEGYTWGIVVNGYRIEPAIYLDWLSRRVQRLGGVITLVSEAITDLGEVAGDVVVNCSGLGARELCGDESVYPVRGQIVAVTNPGLDTALADESDPDRIAYLYPHPHEVVLGGTRQPGRWDTTPEPEETLRILADTARLEPRLREAAVREVRVGLRPGRHRVRLERGLLTDGRPVVHNYGHAGSGFTLSWGCASEAAALALEGLTPDS